MDHGTSLGELGRGWAQRRMSHLGEQEAKKLDRKWVWGTSLCWIPEGWVFSQGDSEKDPASDFPLPFPELVQGLEECPWSVGPVLSVIHLSVPTFK